MVDMRAPNGAVVTVRDEMVARLLDAGFSPVEQPEPPKKRTTRKRTIKKE